jgi:hypothetical protein
MTGGVMRFFGSVGTAYLSGEAGRFLLISFYMMGTDPAWRIAINVGTLQGRSFLDVRQFVDRELLNFL